MQHEKILEFSNFLTRPPKSYNEIAKFLAMNTFSEQEIRASSIGELTETGVVCSIGRFGWSPAQYNLFADLPIHEKYPLTDAIRTNEVIVLKNDEAFSINYPLMAEFNKANEWTSGVTIPVYPIGGMALYSEKKFELDEAMKVFFVAIGSLLGLYASRIPTSLVEVAIDARQKIDLAQVPLTDRQLVIAGLLERGYNNGEIGAEIGYSESLIRQESVAIYRKLHVTGRKAMQAINTLNLATPDNIQQE
jgi:DNA-binding CsgD family transcriptional regulator